MKMLTERTSMAFDLSVPLDLTRGENRAILSGLTPEIIDDSVQTTTFKPDVSILDLKVSETYLTEFEQEEVKRLKERLEEVERAILIKNAEKEALKLLSSTIERFSPQFKDQQMNIPAINSYFELLEKIFKKPEEVEVTPRVEEELTAVNFILPKGVGIPSDGMPHRVVLASKEKEGVFKYTTVPRFSPYVYLKVEFENPFAYPMLSGEMKVYLDNRFAGEILINRTLHPGEKRDIPLGIDESIKVERKLIKKFTEYQGTFTKETAINYEYLTEITNGKAKEIELELRDNLPVSRNEKIKIEIKEPEDKSIIKEDSSYTLLLKLKPKETYRLKTSFTIIFPREWEITGVE